MNAGKLRHRLTIQYPDKSYNEINEQIVEWKDLTIVWGAIEPLRGTTYFAAKQANAEVDGKITLRYKDLKPTYRLVWEDQKGNTRIFNIVSIIQPQQRGKETQVYYSEALD
jgi:SPP1 family predicted phage head-tail adaptor